MAIIVFAIFGNYPTPLIGYGSSAILGYCLSIAALFRERDITEEVYDGMDLTPCPRCEVSRTPAIAVASRERIFEILGYN
jgi:hypothetical protein